MAHLDPLDDRYTTHGWFADGKRAFISKNLAGLIHYGRKHGVTVVTCGDTLDGRGSYRVTFGNGAISMGLFDSPSVMLGFFLGRTFVERVECDRTTFNMGTAFGRVRIPRLACGIGRDGTAVYRPWVARAVPAATANDVPKVIFTRQDTL